MKKCVALLISLLIGIICCSCDEKSQKSTKDDGFKEIDVKAVEVVTI